MNKITEEQKKVISNLRDRTIDDVTPKMLEDVSLFYRFAKARDFNLVEAENMLRKHIAWRKEYQVDTLLTDYKPPEVLVKYIPTTFMGFDKDGSLVRFNDCGRVDVNGLWNVIDKTELFRYVIYIMEKDKETMIKQGINLGDHTLHFGLYNFEDFSYTKAVSVKAFQFAVNFLKTVFDNYPETTKRCWVLNAPTFFSWFYAALKHLLPDSIQQKIRIYGTDGWKEDVLEFIDADNLPVCLGGNKSDPSGNPLCENLIHYGRTIPKSYFMNRKGKKLSLEPDVQKLTVMPRSKEEIRFDVQEMNTYLEWEFETKSKDINFSLLFSEESSETFKPLELIAQQRIDTHNESEKGYLKCEKAGNYTIVFDNSYSWLQSKEIYFRAGLRNTGNADISDAS